MSDALTVTDKIFFDQSDFDPENAQRLILIAGGASHQTDDSDLFMEYSVSEALSWRKGEMRNPARSASTGYAMRFVEGMGAGLATRSGIMTKRGLQEAVREAHSIARLTQSLTAGQLPQQVPQALYTANNPLNEFTTDQKKKLCQDIENYAMSLSPMVRQVAVSLTGSWQAVQIIRHDGSRVADLRPQVRLSVHVFAGDGKKMEKGTAGMGGRMGYADLFNEKSWQRLANHALRRAFTNLMAEEAPSGELPVIIGSGWAGGVQIHEAVGHGLEADFTRKNQSVYSDRVGQKVAADCVTVVDQGNIPDMRGSLHFDDEGTPTGRTVLIERGILKGYMNDRLNARLMGVPCTGNGRRESFLNFPIPRMTSTMLMPGNESLEEMIRGVKKGLLCLNFAGGTVNVTSGDFNFAANESYMIEDGKICHPVKDVNLTGNGPECMQHVDMIGGGNIEDYLRDGLGTCGKDGQSVPVGAATPFFRIPSKITIGGAG